MSERLFIIESDEAFDLATALAHRLRCTTDEIVDEALLRYEKSLGLPDQSSVEVGASPSLCEAPAPLPRGV